MSDVENLIDNYYSWLKDKTVWKKIDKWAEITTPYIDHNNDYIQIYLKQTPDGYFLTDDGDTISNLREEGCKLETPKRKAILKSTLNGYGVNEENDKLQVKANERNFALKKHSLIQAILAVNDMFFLAESHITSLFFEDVRKWLDISEIRYSEQVSFIGHSGYARKFDFLISKSTSAYERMIKTINNPNRHSADSIIVDWVDTRDIRPEKSKAYALINDQSRNVSSSIIEALDSYDIKPVLWSERENVQVELAA
ncbi:DUF1829 domain-containing protein [Sneathiella sp.]|uniref:DUF1829 domain-containing protein n=1 Tax=Sneathiella sp. TaxID=1964365 RepID=UPI003566980C